VTPDGFPLAYEVMNGNTSDRTTLKSFLAKIESTYGKARRVWVMDRGIPSEAQLKQADVLFGRHTERQDQSARKEVVGFTVAEGA
jgi:transposase